MVKGDDLFAFNQFFTNYHQGFIRFAWTYTRDEAAAEDIVMESLMSYWENRHKLSPGVNPSAYVVTIIKNNCLNHLRHLQIAENVSENISSHSVWELSNRIATLEACEPNELFREEVQRIADEVIARLPLTTARVFKLSRYDNLSHKEIAEQLNITTKGVEYHISKATKELRVALKDYLIFLPFLYRFFS